MSIINRNGWAVYEIRDPRYPRYTIHTVPISDWYDHALSPRCSCSPVIEGSTVMHNSYDGREHIESLLDPENICWN